ncbi:acyl-CoA synthetase [Pikeienuella piscinae]|uniref:3-methylmercaptopropionyl-CoA ligase n=1 Tax=Pikeienuella piscinae TaxID=2748098 RepID=A0A7L5C1H5_9RHOB|nr:acyl-CoA synthetase [Pikeienuella piscinae]QIE56336.1 acyl-CoA synthetase [Pikeienuella piscinae]
MNRSPYETGLDRREANFQPLSPLSFLSRAALVNPDKTAIIHGALRRSYAEFYARARQLGSALAAKGIRKNDTVAALLLNTPAMLEAHYGVPMAGAVLNALNTRLDPATVAFILNHGEAKVLIFDSELAPVVSKALESVRTPPLLIEYADPESGVAPALGVADYEEFIAAGDPEFAWSPPDDEWDAIALNYTSGTTGDPKGVVYHHRGAALLATGNALHTGMNADSVYLWTLPMFHCNGWCFPWTVSAVMGTHVCLRAVRAAPIFDALADHGVTHLCGAPIVMQTLLNAPAASKRDFSQRAAFLTAAAPPPETVLAAMGDAGFEVTHLYGLTECYGPSVINEWKPEWSALAADEQAAKKARQGVRYLALDDLAVMDPESMAATPADGETIGEVMMRGNVVMKGYLKNEPATEAALKGGWFHTGDLGVLHPDGYIQLKDRAKDIIISGGENISSIEIEDALFRHPAVAACAVVARPDEKWGETPCAFVELKPGATATEAELIAFARERLAGFKTPKTVVFQDLPKTSTGKVQKFELRRLARAL